MRVSRSVKEKERKKMCCNQGKQRLSCWFGLGHGSFLTLPRVLMEAMPEEWQDRMAELLEQYDEAWDWTQVKDIGSRVQITDGEGHLIKTPAWLINYRRPDFEMIEILRRKKENKK